MNLTALVLGLVFAAVAAAFFARSKREADGPQRRDKRAVAGMFLVPAIGFLIAFVISAVR